MKYLFIPKLTFDILIIWLGIFVIFFLISSFILDDYQTILILFPLVTFLLQTFGYLVPLIQEINIISLKVPIRIWEISFDHGLELKTLFHDSNFFPLVWFLIFSSNLIAIVISIDEITYDKLNFCLGLFNFNSFFISMIYFWLSNIISITVTIIIAIFFNSFIISAFIDYYVEKKEFLKYLITIDAIFWIFFYINALNLSFLTINIYPTIINSTSTFIIGIFTILPTFFVFSKYSKWNLYLNGVKNPHEKEVIRNFRKKYKIKEEDFVINISGNVIYLNLIKKSLYSIPESINKFSQLKNLDLSSNSLDNINHLENLSQLQELRFFNNQIKKIEGLEGLTQLKVLVLKKNMIEKIEGLEKLAQLQILNLKKNMIEKIEGLEELTQLQLLNLKNNRIIKIEGLKGLLNLKTLNLSYNKIVEIEGLEDLSKLEDLYITDNKIPKKELKFIETAKAAVEYCNQKKNRLETELPKKHDIKMEQKPSIKERKLSEIITTGKEKSKIPIEKKEIHKNIRILPPKTLKKPPSKPDLQELPPAYPQIEPSFKKVIPKPKIISTTKTLKESPSKQDLQELPLIPPKIEPSFKKVVPKFKIISASETMKEPPSKPDIQELPLEYPYRDPSEGFFKYEGYGEPEIFFNKFLKRLESMLEGYKIFFNVDRKSIHTYDPQNIEIKFSLDDIKVKNKIIGLISDISIVGDKNQARLTLKFHFESKKQEVLNDIGNIIKKSIEESYKEQSIKLLENDSNTLLMTYNHSDNSDILKRKMAERYKWQPIRLINVINFIKSYIWIQNSELLKKGKELSIKSKLTNEQWKEIIPILSDIQNKLEDIKVEHGLISLEIVKTRDEVILSISSLRSKFKTDFDKLGIKIEGIDKNLELLQQDVTQVKISGEINLEDKKIEPIFKNWQKIMDSDDVPENEKIALIGYVNRIIVWKKLTKKSRWEKIKGLCFSILKFSVMLLTGGVGGKIIENLVNPHIEKFFENLNVPINKYNGELNYNLIKNEVDYVFSKNTS